MLHCGWTSIVVNSKRRGRQFSTTRNPDSLSHGQGTVSTSWLFRAGRQRARLQGTRRDKSSQIAAECFATSPESAPRYPREKPGMRNIASPRNLGCIIQKLPLRPTTLTRDRRWHWEFLMYPGRRVPSAKGQHVWLQLQTTRLPVLMIYLNTHEWE